MLSTRCPISDFFSLVYLCEVGVTCAIMCQAGKGYSLWLCKSHEQEHPDVTANCDD